DLALKNLSLVTNDNPIWPWDYVIHFKNVVTSNKAMVQFQHDPSFDVEFFLNRTLKSSETAGEPHITRGTYFSLAKVSFTRTQYEKAFQYVDSTLQMLHQFPDNATLLKTIRLQGRCYAELGDIGNANEAYERYDLISDSVDQAKALKLYINATVDFDTKAKEAALIKSKEEFEKSNDKNWYLSFGLIGMIVLSLILIGLIIAIVKSRKLAIKQKKQLHHALEDKNVLLKEIHHRVKNNLQIISGLLELQADKLDNPELTKTFNESQLQIQSIALVHQMLYELGDPSSIKMQEYLKNLSLNSIPITSRETIHCIIEADNIELSLEKATPIGLLTSELLINSIKHAFPKGEGEINISLKKSMTGDVVFTYKDNGVGVKGEFKTDGGSSIGMMLVQMLSEEIQGKLTMNGENGFYLEIRFVDV
ncbi:MAG: two-component sensor histidine kinase, partial [Bacteroidia bacterium]